MSEELRTIGNYELVEAIASGGMGIVYRARHRVLGTMHAVKELAPNLAVNEKVRTRFEQEAYVQANLKHSNIVRVSDILMEGACLAIVMSLVEGPSLEDVLSKEKKGCWSYDDVRVVMRPIIEAMAYAHSRGVVHRDIKPGNILMDRSQDAQGLGTPMICDFGIAKIMSSAAGMTRQGAVMGSMPYMAPEQARGEKKIGDQADVYALGILFWQLFAGRLPVNPEDMVSMMEVYAGRSAIPSLSGEVKGLPQGVAEVVAKMIAFEPGNRPAHAGEVLDLLRNPSSQASMKPQAQAPTPAPPPPTSQSSSPPPPPPPTSQSSSLPSPPPPPPSEEGGAGPISQLELDRAFGRRKWLKIAAGLVVVVAGAATVLLISDPKTDPPDRSRSEIGTASVALSDSDEIKKPEAVIPLATEVTHYERVVALKSEPSGAEVRVDGQYLGTTPLTFPYDERKQSKKLSFSWSGYETHEVLLSPEIVRALPDWGIQVRLRHKPQPTPTPVAAPAESPRSQAVPRRSARRTRDVAPADLGPCKGYSGTWSGGGQEGRMTGSIYPSGGQCRARFRLCAQKCTNMRFRVTIAGGKVSLRGTSVDNSSWGLENYDLTGSKRALRGKVRSRDGWSGRVKIKRTGG